MIINKTSTLLKSIRIINLSKIWANNRPSNPMSLLSNITHKKIKVPISIKSTPIFRVIMKICKISNSLNRQTTTFISSLITKITPLSNISIYNNNNKFPTNILLLTLIKLINNSSKIARLITWGSNKFHNNPTTSILNLHNIKIKVKIFKAA